MSGVRRKSVVVATTRIGGEPRVAMSRKEAARRCAAVLDEKFFRAFAEPARVAAFHEVVLLGQADVGAIAERLPQDRSVVSRHLQVLAEAGVLSPTKIGRRTLYEVNALEIVRRLEKMLAITRQLSSPPLRAGAD